MKQALVKLFGGQALADLAEKIQAGDYGRTVQALYQRARGRKRRIGYYVYVLGFALAATATALGCAASTVPPGCELTIALSQGVTWAGWGLMQLGILDHRARRKPEGVPQELAGVAGNQVLIGALVWGTAVLAPYLGVPPEVSEVFVSEVLVLTLIQAGLLAPGTAASIALPQRATT